MADEAEEYDCPECKQGKHRNCTLDVLDDDGWHGCSCLKRNHKEIKDGD